MPKESTLKCWTILFKEESVRKISRIEKQIAIILEIEAITDLEGD